MDRVEEQQACGYLREPQGHVQDIERERPEWCLRFLFSNGEREKIRVPVLGEWMEITQERLIARVELAGKRFSTFEDVLIDTGAAFTVVPAEIADFLELKSYEEQPKVELVTASGLIKPSVRILERLEVGDIKMKNLPVVIHEISDPTPIKILLDMNFIKRTKLMVNGKQKSFEIKNP